MHKNKTIFLAPLGLVGITILSGVFLMSSYSHATSDNTDAVDDVSITVPVSCSMEGTGMNSHNANIVNGTYQADIGSTTLKVFCNDEEGFAIYAIGFTDDEYGKTVLTNNTLGSTYDIATGTATSGSTSNWAMKLATNTSATYALTLDNGFGSYSSVPATYTKVAHRDSGTDTGTSATGSELTSTYAAYMNQTQPAGTYTGQVKYTLVHPSSEEPLQPQPATAGCINYFANASSAIGEMGCQSASNNVTTTLWASNFKRTGYGFAGWNDAFDYSGNFYGPNQTITAPSDVQTNGLSLYAVWVKSAGTIQNWNGCNLMNIGDVTALTDNRDNDTYAVAKLADNRCWMIENLRLADKDSNNNDINLSSTNTHNPSTPLNNSWYYKNQQGTLTTSNHLSATSDPTSTSPDTAWCDTNSSDCIDQSMLATNNTTLFTSNTASSYDASSNVYSYGNYYNWYSATAGHGKYNNGSGYDTYIAPGDICPAGWHLPTGKDDSGEFGVLDIALGGTGHASGGDNGTTMSRLYRSYPNNFIYSGHVYAQLFSRRKSFGYYWSSSEWNNSNAYDFYIDMGGVSPGADTQYGASKLYGDSVRCIADV